MSFFTSLTGLNAATAQLGVTSNNIANASTVGFKRSRADFGDIFATSPLQKATSTIGQGVSLKRVTQEFGQGNMNFSSNTLDLAISGDGFFPLKSADGFQDIFTRNGSFMMNDQYNVVNSAGQRLMAASVDSTGKANLNDLNVLTIPQKTTGMAKETSLVQLGLNFPADAQVVTKAFNRNDPASYNKSTALTVYDKGGNGYLATVYYAKTQNASQADPNNKWQTYVYVGDTLVAAALQQATDTINGERLYVNKYGQLKPEGEVSDLLVNAKTQKFSLNQLTDKRSSEPATVTGGKAPNLSSLTGINFKNLNTTQLKNMFSIDVDDTGVPVQVGLDHLAGKDLTLSGTQIAKELTNVMNRKFGDERYFNFSGQQNFQLTVANADGTLTQNRTVQLDATDMTYEQVAEKINNQLNGSSNVLSNVSFSDSPASGEFKGYSFKLGTGVDQVTVSGQVALPTPLSTKPMEDLATALQDRIQNDLINRFGYDSDTASKVTVNVQNGDEIRLTNGNGPAVTGLSLSTVSAGSPPKITNSYRSGTLATGPIGTYDTLDLTIGTTVFSKTASPSTALDISKLDSSTLDGFAKELQTLIQTQLISLKSQPWSKFDAEKLSVKVDAGKLLLTDESGRKISNFSFTTAAVGTAPAVDIPGTVESSALTLDNVAFADQKLGAANRLNHFEDFTVEVTQPDGTVLSKTVTFDSVLAADTSGKLANFDPAAADGLTQLNALADAMNTQLNAAGWVNKATNASATPAENLKLTWNSDGSGFKVETLNTPSAGSFVSDFMVTLNTGDSTFGKLLTKGAGYKLVEPEVSAGVVTKPGSFTLSNVSFPLAANPVGDEFASFSIKIGGTEAGGPIYTAPLTKLALSGTPMADLALALQTQIRANLKNGNTTGGPWVQDRVDKITVTLINGKDLKITDGGGGNVEALTLVPKTYTGVVASGQQPSVGGANLGIPGLDDSVKVNTAYDPVTQKFSFTPPLGKGATVTLAGVNNQMGITTTLIQDAGSDSLSISGAPDIKNTYIRPAKFQRFGLKVEYDTVNEKFIFKSGTTGDNSSISVNKPNSFASERFGIAADGNYQVAPSTDAVRGIASQPAVMNGSPMGINANNNFSVNLTNNKFVVSVDDVKGTVYLEPKDTYTIDSFVQALQNGINRLSGPSDQPGLTGSTVSGVKVTYDKATNTLKFTTGTASTNSFIKVSGDSQWGLANVDGGRGSTSTWIKPTQYTQKVNGVDVAMYIDEFGKETFSPDGFKNLPEWSPIFLEKGELTFDTSGNLVSPKQGSQLDTVFLPDGKGALTININYSKSTQFSSPYAVLSQSQDGAPEGDLVGLSIGDDGLVNASYSNGSQKSLGKVVLVNFSNPTGLRQIGDTSYYKSSSSGTPKYGEAGSAGFGTVRSGATERANVDLTQELVDLITEQRNFQANAKAIETSTTLTQSIIQIRA